MANFRKSFNFRNGVQVDEDNFIVNSAGLVGIGTSVPTEFLDVRGSLKVVGIATIQDAFIGVGTVTEKLEVGITSFSSGIITAKSGIVTYYGDARYLQGMPTSQWVDIDVGLGYTSIYAAGNVGVGTVDPRFTFQVGGNNDVLNFSRGVAISDVGDVRIAGIATITKIYGYGIGVTGLNATDAIATGTLDNDRLPSNINKPTGIVTASSFLGDLTGNADTASDLLSTANISIVGSNVGYSTAGISTVYNTLRVVDGAKLAVGDQDPQADIEVRSAGISSIQVVSTTQEARLILGKSITGAASSYGYIQFGNTNGSYLASNSKSLDIVNYDTGSVNTYLHLGDAGINTGRWGWIYGQTLFEAMSLTYDGKLGIGKTNPDETLHVVGTSTVTGNTYFGGNVEIVGNISPSTLNVSGTSIFSGRVGIITDSVTNDLQVGNPASVGVGINSTGTVVASQSVTAPFVSANYIDVNANIELGSAGVVTCTTVRCSQISNGSNLLQFFVSGGNLILTVPGVGSTTLALA